MNLINFKKQFLSIVLYIILCEMVKKIVKTCNSHYFGKNLFIVSDTEITMRSVEAPLLCKRMNPALSTNSLRELRLPLKVQMLQWHWWKPGDIGTPALESNLPFFPICSSSELT